MAKSDIISRLRLDSGEFDSKIKRAGQELLAYSEHCKKVGLQMGYANKDAVAFAKQLGSMSTTSQTARGKINELSEAFVNAKVMYKNMTDAEKNSKFGRNLSASLDQLKSRLQSAKKDLADVTKELGGTQTQGVDLSNVMQTLGPKFGISSDAMGLLTTGTIGYTAAIGGLTTAVIAGTKAWADYNKELARQSQITTVTTGLKGLDADRMTDAAKSVADVYGTDFREVINAANTLMTQFGKSGNEAMQLIRDGMQGMIQGDGPKLLSMIQQYAPAFRDAGISASQLVAVIQNSEGGIFTDQNMNAIVMGIKNIRLMTKATSDALAQLGIDGQKMSKDLNEGTITIFDALKQVATQIQGVNSSSQAAGEVMQQVFGRQGAMAGTKLGEAIATLNTNLQETKRQTGEVGQAYADLQGATERLNGAIREAFGYDGYEVMATGIKTKLYTAMADVLDLSLKIKDSWVGSVGKTIFDAMTDSALKLSGPLGTVLSLLRDINSEKGGGSNGKNSGYSDIDKSLEYIGRGANEAERQKRYDAAINDLRKKIDNLDKEKERKNPDGSTSYYILSQDKQDKYRDALERRIKMLEASRERVVSTPDSVVSQDPIKPITPKGDKTTTNKATPKTEEQQNTARIAELVKQYQDLATAAKTADDAQRAGLTERMAKIQGEIKTLQDRNTELKKFADEARQVQYPVGSLPQLNEQLKTLQTEQAKALDAKQWHDYQSQIEQTQYQIDALKGKWKDGLQATFKLNIEQQGSTDINTAKPDDVTVTFKADDADVLAKLHDIEGVNIDDKTMTVTAETAEAYNKVQELLKSVDGKTVTFAVQPKMETGISIQNDAGMSAYIASLKQQLETADYGTSLYNGLSAQLADMNTLQNLVGASLKAGLGTAMFDVADETGKDFWTRAMEGGVEDTDWQAIVDEINEKLKALNIDPIKIDFKTGNVKSQAKEMAKDWQAAGAAIQAVGSAMSQIEDPAAKVVGTIAQAVASIGLGAAQAIANAHKDPSTSGWAWIAYAASVTATMISTIASLHSATGYANGGVVKGSSYSGDNIHALVDGSELVGLNAGEIVLNAAQQSNVAQSLQGAGLQNLRLSTEIDAESIKIILNNNGERTGNGEYIKATLG